MKGLIGAVKCWLVSYNAHLCSPPARWTPPPSQPWPASHRPSLAGWGHSVAEVRSLFEGQIINPTK